jgi:hypothetical protein
MCSQKTKSNSFDIFEIKKQGTVTRYKLETENGNFMFMQVMIMWSNS